MSTSESKLKGKKVLVVEDEVRTARMLSLLLERRGALVRVADNQKRAIEEIKDQKYNVLIVDGEVPLKEGERTQMGVPVFEPVVGAYRVSLKGTSKGLVVVHSGHIEYLEIAKRLNAYFFEKPCLNIVDKLEELL